MSELPDLPPVVRRSRPVPAGGLEAAMAAGARRRNRMLAVAGGTTTALVLVLAGTLALPGGGTDSLGVAERPSPEPAPTSSPEQAPQEQVPAPDGIPAPGVPTPLPPGLAQAPPPDAVVPPPTASGSGGQPAAPGPGRPPRPATGPAQPTAAPPPPAAARPAYREDTDEDASGGGQCVPGAVGACTYTNSNGGIARRGMQAQIWLGHCNGRDSVGDQVYGFDGGQEKEVAVTDEAGAEVFRFSATVRYVEGAHERRVRVGRCLQWTGRWDLVTTDGRPVPAGKYRMTLTVRADRQRYENAPPSTDGGPYVQEVSGSVTVLD